MRVGLVEKLARAVGEGGVEGEKETQPVPLSERVTEAELENVGGHVGG